MTTTEIKSVNRGWLLRQAKQGKLWVKCNYHLTDDYAHDAAVNNGQMDSFVRVYVREEFHHDLEDRINNAYANGATHEDVEPMRVELSRIRETFGQQQNEKARGMVMLWAWSFRTKSGHVWGDKKGGSFSVHSNLNYEYEVR